MPRSYPMIKRMHKSFRRHPVLGYLIERWEFEPIVKWWTDDVKPGNKPSTRRGPSRWSRMATGR